MIPTLGHCQTRDKVNLRSGPAQVFLHFFIFSLVTGNIHNNLISLGHKYRGMIFLLAFDKSMHVACRWMVLQGKGSLTKLRIPFSKYQFSEALEGTYAALKYLAQTAATVHRSREPPQQYQRQVKSQTELFINSKRFSNF